MKRIALSVLALLFLGWCYLWLFSIPSQVVAMESAPVTESPADQGLAYEAFSVSPGDRDLTIQGWWMPATDPVASLVFIHGGGSNRTSSFFSSLEFYRALVDRRVSVAAIDLRNHGDSDRDGQGARFGLSEQHDARAAIELVTAIYHSARTGERVDLPLGPEHPFYEGWVPERSS